MFRSHFMHVGGSMAINEAQYYAPGSYYLTAQSPSLPHRDTFRMRHLHAHEHEQEDEEEEEDRDRHVGHGHRHLHNHGDEGVDADWGSWPTGEMCGSVFWTKLNQRLHRLMPNNETFVAEMEREIFNEGLGHQGINGTGIRYFSNMNGVKEDPGNIGTCCEGAITNSANIIYIYNIYT
jgi:hypothetical protein